MSILLRIFLVMNHLLFALEKTINKTEQKDQ